MTMKTNDNSYIAAPKPSEAKYLTSISIPYDSYEHALTAIPKSYRHIGLTININKNEYWFYNGIEDSDLIAKNLSEVFINVTYEELNQLKTDNNIIPNQKYCLIDFETSYLQYVTDIAFFTGINEKLILEGKTTNSLYSEGRSLLNPKDIIYYDINNSNGSTFGRIIKRIDTEKSNEIINDWRYIKVRRWELNVTDEWISSGSYNRGSINSYLDDIYFCTELPLTNTSPDVNKSWIKYPYKNGDFVSTQSTGQKIHYNDEFFIIPVSENYVDKKIFDDYENSSIKNIKILATNVIVFGNNNSDFIIEDGSDITIGDGNQNIQIENSIDFVIGNNNSKMKFERNCNSFIIGSNNSDIFFGTYNSNFLIGEVNAHLKIENNNQDFSFKGYAIYISIQHNNRLWNIPLNIENLEILINTIGDFKIIPINDFQKKIYFLNENNTIFKFIDEFGDINLINL